MPTKHLYSILFFGFICLWCRSQNSADNDFKSISYAAAYDLAYEGKNTQAKNMLIKIVSKNPTDTKAKLLLASTYSWNGQYDKARTAFNKITSVEPTNRSVWIAAIKNELYAKEEAIAFGLSNKALMYLKNDKEIERLREEALNRIKAKKYPEIGWYNKESSVKTSKELKKALKKEKVSIQQEVDTLDSKSPVYKDALNNRFTIRNSATVFNDRYDPMFFSSISYKRQTLAGSIIPRINYSNRLGKNGLQYDLDFYPKFSKRFYAYLNYGFSNASIYPNHKFGGDLYTNLPGAFEFSAGGRYIDFKTKNVVSITNSFGHYRGNYYFSLRSYITPRSNNLTRVSGNLLVRKYLKDADNYWGFNVGMGVSPELRQIISGDVVLAETQLFIESQRLSLEYQFTGKKNKTNIYKANIAVVRQEQIINSQSYLWSVSTGITYNVKF